MSSADFTFTLQRRLHLAKPWLMGTLLGLVSLQAQAFCGFYVGKADASLFNEASQVAIVRDEDKTVISMLNDYKGDLREFALVVPVPTVLSREQINVGDAKLFARLDAYSAPRLAEYFDPNPCAPVVMYEMAAAASTSVMRSPSPMTLQQKLGVKVEAQYTVGEYDIVILSAKESDGLETWLTSNGYKIPAGARKALKPYINQGLKFFVAKVNLKEQAKSGYSKLRPLQFAYDDKRFMLPIRLGLVNSTGVQDLIVYALTRQGRVESSNYRTQKLPANMDLPPLIKNDFKGFYKTLFDTQAKREGHKVVFTEYFWDMSWCDPCAADPLSNDELRDLGVFWLDNPDQTAKPSQLQPNMRIAPPRPPAGGAQPVMLTRLHVRYTADTFPEDLMFTQTKDRENFQTRYVMRHPWTGNPQECTKEQDKRGVLLDYLKSVEQRQEVELQTLARLTNGDIQSLRAQSDLGKTQSRIQEVQRLLDKPAKTNAQPAWWQNLWRK